MPARAPLSKKEHDELSESDRVGVVDSHRAGRRLEDRTVSMRSCPHCVHRSTISAMSPGTARWAWAPKVHQRRAQHAGCLARDRGRNVLHHPLKGFGFAGARLPEMTTDWLLPCETRGERSQRDGIHAVACPDRIRGASLGLLQRSGSRSHGLTARSAASSPYRRFRSTCEP